MTATVLPFAVRCSRCAREIRFDIFEERYGCTGCGAHGLCISCAENCVSAGCVGRILKAE